MSRIVDPEYHRVQVKEGNCLCQEAELLVLEVAASQHVTGSSGRLGEALNGLQEKAATASNSKALWATANAQALLALDLLETKTGMPCSHSELKSRHHNCASGLVGN